MNDLSQRFRDFDTWLQQPLGEQLLSMETEAFHSFLPSLIGQHALLLGSSLQECLMASCSMVYRQDRALLLSGFGEGGAEKKKTCIQDQSTDLIVLPHTLEYVYDASMVLKETVRLLRPAGYVLVAGFHPYHPWVVWQQHRNVRYGMPWGGRLRGFHWLKDYLQQLNFEILKTQSLYLNKASFLWRLFGGEVYVLLARRSSVAMTPSRVLWHTKALLKPSTSSEASRVHCDNKK